MVISHNCDTVRSTSVSAFSATRLPTATPILSQSKSSSLSLSNQATNGEPLASKSKAIQSLGRRFVYGAAWALVTLTFLLPSTPANAAKAAGKAAVVATTTEHLHTGQKIANWFTQFGLPKWAVLATISAMPVVELRGAVPVGIWMGLPITQVLPICVLGNMAPIIPLLFLLRNQTLK